MTERFTWHQKYINNINSDLESLVEWLWANKLSLNIEKTNYVVVKQNPTQLDEHLKIKIGTIKQNNDIKFIDLTMLMLS